MGSPDRDSSSFLTSVLGYLCQCEAPIDGEASCAELSDQLSRRDISLLMYMCRHQQSSFCQKLFILSSRCSNASRACVSPNNNTLNREVGIDNILVRFRHGGLATRSSRVPSASTGLIWPSYAAPYSGHTR
eukprot:6452470-Amphidinium_carterae.1